MPVAGEANLHMEPSAKVEPAVAEPMAAKPVEPVEPVRTAAPTETPVASAEPATSSGGRGNGRGNGRGGGKDGGGKDGGNGNNGGGREGGGHDDGFESRGRGNEGENNKGNTGKSGEGKSNEPQQQGDKQPAPPGPLTAEQKHLAKEEANLIAKTKAEADEAIRRSLPTTKRKDRLPEKKGPVQSGVRDLDEPNPDTYHMARNAPSQKPPDDLPPFLEKRVNDRTLEYNRRIKGIKAKQDTGQASTEEESAILLRVSRATTPKSTL